MKKIKVLNLYAGIGGNRKFWENVEVTAVENNSEIAAIYQEFFPDDKVIVADAHQYLLEHYQEFDFIWSSPPCPSHSCIRKQLAVQAKKQNKPIYPDMKLYEEILLLQGYCKCKWVVENVISWYEPLIKPFQYKHHYFWSNFNIIGNKNTNRFHHASMEQLQIWKGFEILKYKKMYKNLDIRQILRNCVEPETGLHVFECSQRKKQKDLFSDFK